MMMLGMNEDILLLLYDLKLKYILWGAMLDPSKYRKMTCRFVSSLNICPLPIHLNHHAVFWFHGLLSFESLFLRPMIYTILSLYIIIFLDRGDIFDNIFLSFFPDGKKEEEVKHGVISLILSRSLYIYNNDLFLSFLIINPILMWPRKLKMKIKREREIDRYKLKTSLFLIFFLRQWIDHLVIIQRSEQTNYIWEKRRENPSKWW